MSAIDSFLSFQKRSISFYSIKTPVLYLRILVYLVLFINTRHWEVSN
jgi:hypothetical protein